MQRAIRAREALGRLLTAMAGNLPGYEEAGRALYAGNRQAFDDLVACWPGDLRSYVQQQASEAFPPADTH